MKRLGYIQDYAFSSIEDASSRALNPVTTLVPCLSEKLSLVDRLLLQGIRDSFVSFQNRLSMTWGHDIF